jgi:hypothetical protein
MVAAPRISPLSIICCASATDTQRTASASSISGSPPGPPRAPRTHPAARPPTQARAGRSAGTPPPRPPPGLLLNLPRSGSGTILTRIDVATRHLPVPPVHDEPMRVNQQQTLPRLIQHDGHHAPPHPERVLLELVPVRELDTGHSQADMRIRIHQRLTVDGPPRPGSGRSLVGHKRTLPASANVLILNAAPRSIEEKHRRYPHRHATTGPSGSQQRRSQWRRPSVRTTKISSCQAQPGNRYSQRPGHR